MLRFWITVSLLMTVVFMGIGLAVSREWGWSEYASPELYLVYAYVVTNVYYPKYSIINADSSSKPEMLSWHGDTITRLNCSPDGRTLALMTDQSHLYVLTAEGVAYDQIIDLTSDWLEVMNNRSVALYFEEGENSYVATIHPDKTLTNEPRSDGYQWLASEQYFMTVSDSANEFKPYIEDAQTGLSAPIHYLSSPLLSPDAIKVALNLTLPGNQRHIYIVDFISQKPLIQLNDDSNHYNNPACFLTFRPQMLIADKQ